MKFQTRIRMQMLMVGLGAALLMTGSARAQQEMDPTYFDVKPGTPAVTKVAVAPAAQSTQAATQNDQAENAVTLASIQESTLEGGVTLMTVVDAGVVLILLAGVFSIAHAMVATRRERTRVSPVSARYTPVSAATAQ
jgi:hypothetical protein